jgi:hypothetical protein
MIIRQSISNNRIPIERFNVKHMKQALLTLILIAGLCFPAIMTMAQEPDTDYNPFVTANLDDVGKLGEASVVESSYHLYTIKGDKNYTELSTFVWYVKNGTLGTYTAETDTWDPLTVTGSISDGEYVELTGTTIGETDNSSQVWVRWNDGTEGSTGYIAVYERSADYCVYSDQITGYKHTIIAPPEVWFLVATREECSDQMYAVTAQFNEINTTSFPYTLTYSYPAVDGTTSQVDTTLVKTDLDDSNQLTWDLFGVKDLDVTADEVYTVTLDELRDNYGSVGNIAPLGETSGQYSQIEITINHLPQTGSMSMD